MRSIIGFVIVLVEQSIEVGCWGCWNEVGSDPRIEAVVAGRQG